MLESLYNFIDYVTDPLPGVEQILAFLNEPSHKGDISNALGDRAEILVGFIREVITAFSMFTHSFLLLLSPIIGELFLF